jgi:hypothetical protein
MIRFRLPELPKLVLPVICKAWAVLSLRGPELVLLASPVEIATLEEAFVASAEVYPPII